MIRDTYLLTTKWGYRAKVSIVSCYSEPRLLTSLLSSFRALLRWPIRRSKLMLLFPGAGSNISIDATFGTDIPERETRSWENSVLSALQLIRAFQTGRIVIESIQNLRPRILCIIPGRQSEAGASFPACNRHWIPRGRDRFCIAVTTAT